MKIKLFTIPNFITLGNLFCGCMAVLWAASDVSMSFLFIMLAAVLDFLDGFAARLLKSYSDVGKQLDSLSDMVSFGLAPAVILYHILLNSMALNMLGAQYNWIAYIVFIVALFSALRLAKFNIDESQKEEFVGLPTPACAIFIASSAHLYSEGLFVLQPWFIIVVAILLAYLLISPVRMFSLKFHNFSFKDNKLRFIFLIIALLTLLLSCIIGSPIVCLPLIIIEYIFLSIFRNILCSKH